MRFAVITASVLILSACARERDEVRAADPPPPPAIVEVPVPYYVPIPDELLARCSWVKSAPLEDILLVTRGRRYCLEVYEAHFDAIRSLRGSPAPTGD